MSKEVTIYADGAKNVEVIRISNDPAAPTERTVCECAPGNAPECHQFNLRRGDFLIVRLED
jgi:hypothetical protein